MWFSGDLAKPREWLDSNELKALFQPKQFCDLSVQYHFAGTCRTFWSTVCACVFPHAALK